MRNVGSVHRIVGFVYRAHRRAWNGGVACALLGGFLLAGVASGTAAAPAHRAPATKATAEEGASAIVDINAADAEKLATLPGIGPSIAQRIVEYRKEHGPFKAVDELVNVRGVGEKLLTRLRDHITVGSKD